MDEQKSARDLVYESDRGERAYYLAKKTKSQMMKEPFKLPLTKSGCETILEIISEAMELPLDDVMRQDFAGWVHHTEMNVNTFTFSELMKVIHNRMAKTATWRLDQEAKENRKAEQEAAKLATSGEPTLIIAKDADAEQAGTKDSTTGMV